MTVCEIEEKQKLVPLIMSIPVSVISSPNVEDILYSSIVKPVYIFQTDSSNRFAVPRRDLNLGVYNPKELTLKIKIEGLQRTPENDSDYLFDDTILKLIPDWAHFTGIFGDKSTPMNFSSFHQLSRFTLELPGELNKDNEYFNFMDQIFGKPDRLWKMSIGEYKSE